MRGFQTVESYQEILVINVAFMDLYTNIEMKNFRLDYISDFIDVSEQLKVTLKFELWG